MNIRNSLKILSALTTCLVLLSACSQATETNSGTQSGKTTVESGISTTGTESVKTTSTTEASVTTTVAPVVASTTTATKKTENPTTTVAKPTTTVPTTRITVPRATTIEAEETLTFSYESEDYTVFRQYIAKHFPKEKHFDSFRVRKADTTNRKYEGYRIIFNRWINGCETDSFYVFYFDTEENLVEVYYRSFEYDASKVKPPRAATEAEIEAAKQAEAAKIPEGMVVWEQEVGNSHYSIYADRNEFKVTTIYVTQGNYNLYNNPDYEYYGMTPPHAALIETYTIPR